jgi:NAD+ synthase (glutamine-hydrolysing)
MKIALAQLNYTIADFEGNAAKIIHAIKDAKNQGADLIVFSELAVCGYPPDDLLDYPHFIQSCDESLARISAHAIGITVIVGCPVSNKNEQGRKLFNTACVLEQGKLSTMVRKTLLPTYDVFDESRYFEQNDIFEIVHIGGKKVALTICEDLWDSMDSFNYKSDPLEFLVQQSPDMIINISASPFNKNKKDERYDVLRKDASSFKLPLVYVNQVGANTDLVFDGHSLVLNANGSIALEMPSFEEAMAYYDTEETYSDLELQEADDTELLYKSLILGIRDYFRKLGFKNAILGSSGGIDSAVVQALASEAIGAENINAVLMPSHFSSEGSVKDAQKLSETLGNSYQIIPIEGIFNAFSTSLQPLFEGLPFNVAEENMQARSRAVILMAISNKFGNILLNTSNKSEMAVGYTTLYGDMCGSLSVMGDVYKTDVFKLAKYINREKEVIPNEIINKAPSAELRPDQKDSDSLPEYHILDAILEMYIEGRKSPEEIVNKGFDKLTVEKTIQMVNRNEYKRFQAPPILRVTSKAFGRGRVIPLVSKW